MVLRDTQVSSQQFWGMSVPKGPHFSNKCLHWALFCSVNVVYFIDIECGLWGWRNLSVWGVTGFMSFRSACISEILMVKQKQNYCEQIAVTEKKITNEIIYEVLLCKSDNYFVLKIKIRFYCQCHFCLDNFAKCSRSSWNSNGNYSEKHGHLIEWYRITGRIGYCNSFLVEMPTFWQSWLKCLCSAPSCFPFLLKVCVWFHLSENHGSFGLAHHMYSMKLLNKIHFDFSFSSPV